MKATTILGASFAVAASGATVKPRDTVLYNIAGFSAACTPHSVQCGYGFRLTPSTDATGAGFICGNLVQGPDNLPPLPLTACFENTDYAYSIAIADGGLTLTVTSALDASTNITGSHTATADQFTIYNGGTTMSQQYIGPTNFTIVPEEVAV
ncbi:hypothetical protein F5Y08DRAFT_336244 [Xylaria arbuscula]|nr:hypothetical protein F5Y08DRAFT_336244 [Xylaria arbuscula]